MHQLFIIYQSKIIYIKILSLLLHVSIAHCISSSGTMYSFQLKLRVKIKNIPLLLLTLHLNISYQQMHQLYIIYQSKIIYIKILPLLLHVSIAHCISSSGSMYSFQLKLRVKIKNIPLLLLTLHLNISYQQMHQLYIIIYIKTLPLLLHVSIAHCISSSGSTYTCSLMMIRDVYICVILANVYSVFFGTVFEKYGSQMTRPTLQSNQ